jgi:hypothetical protein
MNPNWRNRYLRYRAYFLNVMLKYREKPQVRAYLEILLSFVTISVFGVFAIKPTAVTIAQLLKEIEAKKAIVAQMEAKIGNLEEAQRVYTDNSEKIAILESAIPKRPSPQEFARQVEGLSGKNQVEILKVTTSGGPLVGKPKVEPVIVEEGVEAPPQELFPLLNFSINMKVSTPQYGSLSAFTSDILYKIRNPIRLDVIRMDTQSEKEGKSIILIINGKIPYHSE